MTVFEMIEAQQKGKENTAPWMVGEQLKDICRAEPESAELVAQDLKNQEMSIDNCEKQIKAWADKHKTGNFACVIPAVAEGIIRKFYGLPEKGALPEGIATPDCGLVRNDTDSGMPVLNMADFF